MEPILVLDPTPSNPLQTFPYLYFEPGIFVGNGFATVCIELYNHSTTMAIESMDENGVFC